MILNSPSLCLPSSFANITAGQCVLGNVPHAILFKDAPNTDNATATATAPIACAECCDSKLLGLQSGGKQVCEYGAAKYLQSRLGQLLPPPG